MSKKTPELAAWYNMRSRCLNPNYPKFSCWGGRGITICERWLESFQNFIEDMGPRPGPGYSIERLENNAGYSKANCIWATRAQQQKNRRIYASSGVKGVRQRSGVWEAYATVDGKYVYLGRRKTKEEATELRSMHP